MRGGSQARLVQCSDGRFYVVKFSNNPQGALTLSNEWITEAIFRYLRIATPKLAKIHFSQEFLASNPDVLLQCGLRSIEPEPGVHLGSLFPGDPAETAVYDFLPNGMLNEVVNLPDFVGALAVDRWVSNLDSRQAIFFRGKPRDWAPSVAAHGSRKGLIALMIDHGMSFGGARWEFSDASRTGLFGNPIVYNAARTRSVVETWIDRIRYFPESVLENAAKEIPDKWIECKRSRMDQLIEGLIFRKRTIAYSTYSALRSVQALA